jgi:hypothetical protein
MENMEHIEDERHFDGGKIEFIGIDGMKQLSVDKTSGRLRKKTVKALIVLPPT